jgi:hypothetical protein
MPATQAEATQVTTATITTDDTPRQRILDELDKRVAEARLLERKPRPDPDPMLDQVHRHINALLDRLGRCG